MRQCSDGLGTDGLAGLHIFIHDSSQNFQLAVVHSLTPSFKLAPVRMLC